MFVKKKDFEILKNRVEVLEFQINNLNGMKVIYKILQYVKNGVIKNFKLPSNFLTINWTLGKNNLLIHHKIIDDEYYKFDIENEMLIKIEKQTDTSSKSEEKDIENNKE